MPVSKQIDKNMYEYRTISWKDLPGNKYSKSLDAAMASKQGYTVIHKVKKCHSPTEAFCNVVYDRDYVVQFLIKKVLFSLASLGKEAIDGLINEAWLELNGITDAGRAIDDVAS